MGSDQGHDVVAAGMSRAEVATFLRLSPERVRQLTAAGRLDYTDTALGRLYHRDSVETLAKSRRAQTNVDTSPPRNT